MNIRCIIDSKQFNTKPKGNEVGGIINRMTIDKAKDYSTDEIKNKILNGNTIRPACCGGKENTWQSQQMFMIDIDNKPSKPKGMTDEEYKKLCEEYLKNNHRTYDDIINHCEKINIIPSFIYTSFSHTEECHKMRLVFILDKAITNYDVAKKIQLYLMNSIGEVDKQCKNLNRIYYAGKEIVFDSGNIINTDNIIQISKDIKVNDTPIKVNDSKAGEKCPPNNNKIYNYYSYIIRGTKTPPKDTIHDEKNYNIKAIANRNVEFLKNKLNHPHMVFENNQQFCDYIFKEINLGDLLEFKYPKSIRCIFHDDTNNSASIFQNENGYWIYNCFGCGVSYNLLGVIEVLGKFKSRPKAYKFIREIFNLEIKETEWQKEQKEILLENIKALNGGELEKNCPQAYKNIKSNIKYLNQLLTIAMDNVTTEKMTDNDDNVLFFASNNFIAKQLGMSKDSSKEVSKKTTLMAYHKLLNKVDNSEVNEDLLKRSQAISINSSIKNKKYRHVNYYSIPSYNNLLFSEIEQQGEQWKKNNYTIKGLSREMFYRGEGEKVANWLYPQYKQVYDKKQDQIVDRRTTLRSDKRTIKITEIIMSFIEKQKYCLEKDIIDNLILDKELKISKSEAEKQIKKSLKEILDSYDLKRTRANKELKEQFGIAGNGYPFFIHK